MKSEKFKYFLVIFVTILVCAVKNGDCLSNPVLSKIYQEHVHRAHDRNLKTNDTVHLDSVSEILEFWKHQEERMNIGSQHNVTIFLGTTGAGKSAVISLLAGNDLESIEIYEGSETFRIVDKLGRVSLNSTILSQTLVPELIVDNESGAAYYDCPGFKDTRGVKYDITITYLIRKLLLEYADSVKFVFVIAHSQVSDGGDRNGIIDLARHINGFIKNIDKFSDGIGLVVTKVENVAKVFKGSIAFVDDNVLLEGIQRFLSRAKSDLETLNGNNSLSISEMKANEDAIKFIKILLTNGNDGRPRIGLFRKPSQSGSLTNMSIFQTEKNAIKTIINKGLTYIKKESTDFGFALSDQSKNYVYSLLNEMKNRLAGHITTIGDEIVSFYMNQEKDYKSLTVLYRKAYLLGRTLVLTVAKDPQLYAKVFLNALESANIDRIAENLIKAQTYLKHIEFLTNLTESTDLDLSQVTGALSKVTQNMESYLKKLLGKIENGIIARVFEEYDRIELGISREESQNIDLIYLKNLMLDARKNLPIVGDNYDIVVFLKQFVDSSIFKRFDSPPESLADIMVTIDFLNYLFVDLSTSCKLSISNEANKIVSHFDASSKWYSFLIDLYEQLSQMNLKSNEIKKEANDLMEKCSIGEKQEIGVSEIGLQKFLDMIDIKTKYDLETLQINVFQSKALKNVLALTINMEVKCSADGSTISGFNVKISDAMELKCWQSSDIIKVFALDKILIDVDIDRTNDDLSSKKLSIIAPIWKVIGNRGINLNGKDAQNYWSSASDGNAYSIDGVDGSPGRSGSSAGSFFGIGNEFINGKMLSINANGGDGGSGQNGGRGKIIDREYEMN